MDTPRSAATAPARHRTARGRVPRTLRHGRDARHGARGAATRRHACARPMRIRRRTAMPKVHPAQTGRATRPRPRRRLPERTGSAAVQMRMPVERMRAASRHGAAAHPSKSGSTSPVAAGPPAAAGHPHAGPAPLRSVGRPPCRSQARGTTHAPCSIAAADRPTPDSGDRHRLQRVAGVISPRRPASPVAGLGRSAAPPRPRAHRRARSPEPREWRSAVRAHRRAIRARPAHAGPAR